MVLIVNMNHKFPWEMTRESMEPSVPYARLL